ncbi:MAG TPA: acyl-CoA synthetase [Stellaceae bacterium]|nr:acyl-CoA synthetase [Stellaceae bacterium]
MPPVMNLGRLLTHAAQRFADRPGLVQGDRVWSWAELDRRVDAAVVALRARGYGKGTKLLVQARNGNALFESQFVAFKLGAVWVPTNFRLTPPEVAYLAGSSGASVMLYDTGFEAHVEAAKAAQPALDLVLSIGPPRPGEVAWDALIAEAGATTPDLEAEVAYDDPLWFFYTSGTTGRPKAAMLTHGQMAFVVNNHLTDLMPGTTEDDASLVVAPLSHGAGIHALAQVARGVKNVLMPGERLEVEEAWRLVEAHRVTNMFTVPSIVKLLVEHDAVDRVDHSSLRHVIYAGAPMYRADQKRALHKLGKVLVQYFGLGEVTGNITVLPPHLHALEDDEDLPIGSCGYARTGMEIAILDGAGIRLRARETGEICVRGPAVFAGYYNNPEANAKAFAHGWFHTGDLGYLDAKGFLYITGRASDMYISGGSNVYPREIEELLLTHPDVAEAAVLGMPDPKWGETGVAVLVARTGATIDPAAVLAGLEGRLARYKYPSRIVIWPDLPKSGYGKVPKNLVRQRLLETGE